MNCACDFYVKDYSITLIQGDYGTYIYTICNQNGIALENVKDVFFTCARLKLKRMLSKKDNSTYILILPSELTETFSACTCRYDLTVEFTGDTTPCTIIYNEKFTVLKKENKLNESI